MFFIKNTTKHKNTISPLSLPPPTYMQIIPYPQLPDPLSIFTEPPPNKMPPEQLAHLTHKAEEKRVSDEIDEGLRKEKAKMKKEREGLVKVLLLGQSESGKSTTLKSMLFSFFFSFLFFSF